MIKEFTERNDRLQMSLFKMLYKKAGGFQITPDAVFSWMDTSEWHLLPNYQEAKKIIFDEYFYEANKTMSYIMSGDSMILGHDFYPSELRFGKDNKNEIIEAYKNFVLTIGEKCGFSFDPDFQYFE